MNNMKITFSQYYGVISVRLYDEEKKVNVAKIELGDLIGYLQKKIDKGQYKMEKKGKGNCLSVLKLK
jgi:hypothetical protein